MTSPRSVALAVDFALLPLMAHAVKKCKFWFLSDSKKFESAFVSYRFFFVHKSPKLLHFVSACRCIFSLLCVCNASTVGVHLLAAAIFSAPQNHFFEERQKIMVKIHFGGSRALTQNHFSQVSQVVKASLAVGAGIHVGCAVGADQFIIQSACSFPAQLQIFAQFSSSGAGAFPGSAVSAVLAAQQLGIPVSFLAGGPLSVPLRARLLKRSIAALRGCSLSVHFLSNPASSGSLNTAAQAAAMGIPVYIFPLGFPGHPQALRHLPGAWRPSSFAGFPCLQWAAGHSFF